MTDQRSALITDVVRVRVVSRCCRRTWWSAGAILDVRTGRLQPMEV